jgi:hypothetical protein
MSKQKANQQSGDRPVPFEARVSVSAPLRTAGGIVQLAAGDHVQVLREQGGTGMVKVERSGQHGFLPKSSYDALLGAAAGLNAASARPIPPFNATTSPPIAHLHTSSGVIDLSPGTHIHVSAEENGHGLVSVPGRALAGFMDTSQYTPDP